MINRFAKFFLASLLSTFLFACGGSSPTPTPPAGPVDQVISFATPNAVSAAVGTTVNNVASGGAGTGVITYSSSNVGVATVNATTGAATLSTVGSTTITANKAASSGFNQATATYTLTVTPGVQTISFTQTGPLQVLKGLTLTNAASGGAGTGAITYVSSSSNATVSPTSGQLSGVTSGSAIITATKAADANYTQAQATYTVTVQTTAPVTAWVGATDSQVTLPSIASATNFIRSRDKNCVLANYSTCTSGQLDIVGTLPITDTASNLTNTGYYWLEKSGAATTPLTANVNRFSERIGHQVLYFNNRYWVIGGSYQASANAKADVWSSADGKTWELETPTGAFGKRWFHQSVVYAGKMWVIGGVNEANNLVNTSYSSTDGRTWTLVGSSLPFTAASHEDLNVTVFQGAMWAVFVGRSYSSTDGIMWTPQSTSTAIDGGATRGYASLTAYAGKLWYIAGGKNHISGSPTPTGTASNDGWSSSDGITWTPIAAAPFTPRWRHVAFVLNNRLWIFGGHGHTTAGDGPVNADAWSTTDGTTWTQETAVTSLSRSYLAQIAQETNKVSLIGGILRVYSNQVWQSTDGAQWTQQTSLAPFSPRLSARVVEFLGDMWLIGGNTTDKQVTNEIWRSSDGVNWTRITPVGAIFGPRSALSTVVFNNRLWVIGGWDDTIASGGTDTRTNDVWSTADGINWTQHTQTSPFPARIGTAVTVFAGKMWMIGGSGGTFLSPTYLNDVWSTTDGMNWVQEMASAAFTGRAPYEAVVPYANALWMFGGETTGGTPANDIWRSTDGKIWTIVNATAPAPAPRIGHSVKVFNNRVWVSGGLSSTTYATATRYNDLWSTSDGVNWTQQTAAAQFEPRGFHAMVVHNNELWVIAGWGLDFKNDVWRSADGSNWRVGFSSTFQTP